MTFDEELLRKSLLLQLSGRDSDEMMVEMLGIDASECDALRRATGAWSAEVGQQAMETASPRRPTDTLTSHTEIVDALSRPGWLTVSRLTSPEAIAGPEIHGDFYVDYDDNVAHNLEASVVASVEAIRSFPGVNDARHEDRELILGWGHVDLNALEAHLIEWWRSRLLRNEHA